ncbi:hypothetical protein WUBG_00144 [Wuchereria bancrofti]|uniref:Uncharacterized protein n=1 Tax=Wuchereria bancrofti TaxID=6293 RepID=J9FNH1_WUCBA|nr:hypothetical protein WUBG_00144 [Wuchereria bancrofti]
MTLRPSNDQFKNERRLPLETERELTDISDVFKSSPVCTDHVVVSLHSSLANVLMKSRNNYQWDNKFLRTVTLPSATLNILYISSKRPKRTVFLIDKLTLQHLIGLDKSRAHKFKFRPPAHNMHPAAA